MSDVNVIHAAAVAAIHDRGTPRRGPAQGSLDIIADGAVIVRGGHITAVGPTDELIAETRDPRIPTIDATGKTVLPGLVESHSHPLFAGERHDEYAERLGGASLAEVAAKGGGIWRSVVATREATSEELLANTRRALSRVLAGGVTTMEAKSGYGLTVAHELHQLELLHRLRASTPMQLVLTFLGAHVVPRDLDGPTDDPASAYTDHIAASMLPAVLRQGLATFHDVTVEAGYFTPEQALRLMARGDELGIRARVHADAWRPSQGWSTAVAGGAISAEHLTYTPDAEIDAVGSTDTIAVLLPVAELIYMTDQRANARRFIERGVAVAVATDYCSSIHATSLLSTIAIAAPWFRMTPGEVIVGATLNAAYSLGVQADRGSLDVGKRGDLIVLDCPHPEEVCLAAGAPILEHMVIGGRDIAFRS